MLKSLPQSSYWETFKIRKADLQFRGHGNSCQKNSNRKNTSNCKVTCISCKDNKRWETQKNICHCTRYSGITNTNYKINKNNANVTERRKTSRVHITPIQNIAEIRFTLFLTILATFWLMCSVVHLVRLIAIRFLLRQVNIALKQLIA